MPTPAIPVSGLLNPQELRVAEAIQAQAWDALRHDGRPGATPADKARLGGIVVRLMTDRTQSIGDLSMAAVAAFKAS